MVQPLELALYCLYHLGRGLSTETGLALETNSFDTLNYTKLLPKQTRVGVGVGVGVGGRTSRLRSLRIALFGPRTCPFQARGYGELDFFFA